MIKREHRHDSNIILAMVKVQSLKTKELQISELFEDHALDVLIMTETWLTNKENDKTWSDATDLNKNNTSLHTHNRTKRRGGGLALMCKSHFKVAALQEGSETSFEYCT